MNTNVALQTTQRPNSNNSLLGKIQSLATKSELDCGLCFPDLTKEGKPIEGQINVAYFLRRFEIDLCYDEFSLRTFVFGVPGVKYLDDAAFDEIYVGLDCMGLRVPKDYLWSVLRSHARIISAHPVREMLEKLASNWDGTPRLDTWLIDYCGVEDTPYARAVGAIWLIAAVRRVRRPGCKFDHVLIFEGPQGIGKSTVFRALAYEDWFTDNLTVGLEPKQVIELTRGKWICELAELSSFAKREVEAVKAFVTRQSDEARMAYGRETLEVPRQFVLAATTNRSHYLRDETGDRRFWMVETKGVINSGQADLPLMLDATGLQAIRDQLWAEAAVREAGGEDIYLSPTIEALARAQQMKRFDADDRQQLLEDLLEGKSGFVPNDEVYRAIGIWEIKERDARSTRLIASAMSRLGWTRDRQRVGEPSKQLRGWKSPDGCKDVLAFTTSEGFASVSRASYSQQNLSF